MIKAIIFDFDGVIAESVDIKTHAFAKLFSQEGRGVVKAVVAYHLRHAGVSRFDKFAYIYKNILRRKLSKAVFRKLCRQFSELVINEVIKAPYVKGAKKFLTRYKKQYNFFIVSATPQAEIKSIIRKKGIGSCFKAVYGAPAKKGDLVRKIIRYNKLACRDIVYIGDALSDYEAARANSVNFIARIDGNAQLFKNKNIYCKLRDLSNLKDILEKLNNAQRQL